MTINKHRAAVVADILENNHYDDDMDEWDDDAAKEAATLLRTIPVMEAEIERLKSGCEPVAWMNIDEAIRHLNAHCCAFVYKNSGDGRVPVYTHPAKTLTDEEMEIIAEALAMIGFKDDFISYDLKEKAQAILKKVGDK